MEAINFIKTYHKPYLDKENIDINVYDEDGKNYYYYYILYCLLNDNTIKLCKSNIEVNKVYLPKIDNTFLYIDFYKNVKELIINENCNNLKSLSFGYVDDNTKIIFKITLPKLKELSININNCYHNYDIIFYENQPITTLSIGINSNLLKDLDRLFDKLPKLKHLELYGDYHHFKLDIVDINNKILSYDKNEYNKLKEDNKYVFDKLNDLFKKLNFK